MKCFYCGLEQSNDNAFCEKCGANLRQPRRNIFGQKRKRLTHAFWFLSAILIINFALYFLREILDNINGIPSVFSMLIGVFWVPVLFISACTYIIIRFSEFLTDKLNRFGAGIIRCILFVLNGIISLFLLGAMLGSGHGGPLDFLYEKPLISLLVVTLLTLIPYIFVIVRIILMRKKEKL